MCGFYVRWLPMSSAVTGARHVHDRKRAYSMRVGRVD